MAALLLGKGASVDMQCRTADSADVASQHGHKEAAALLVGKGASVDMQKDGWPALMMASWNGHWWGGDGEADGEGGERRCKTRLGKTALFYAPEWPQGGGGDADGGGRKEHRSAASQS